jgi:hypothetical protein
MRDIEIKVMRACERYARDNYFAVNTEYNPSKDSRKIFVVNNKSDEIRWGCCGIQKGIIVNVEEGYCDGFIDFMKENIPSKLLEHAVFL